MLLVSLLIEYRSGSASPPFLSTRRHAMCAGKAGLSSTSQQLQLLQQVQQAQHLHAVMGHIQRRRFPFIVVTTILFNTCRSPVAGIHQFDVAAAAASDARALKAAVQVPKRAFLAFQSSCKAVTCTTVAANAAHRLRGAAVLHQHPGLH